MDPVGQAHPPRSPVGCGACHSAIPPVIDHNGDVDPLRLLAVAAGVVQSLRPTLVPRTTRHQRWSAVCAATTGVTTTAIPDVPWRVGRWIVPVGLGWP